MLTSLPQRRPWRRSARPPHAKTASEHTLFSALLAELATQLRDHGTLDGRLAALGKQAARDAFPA